MSRHIYSIGTLIVIIFCQGADMGGDSGQPAVKRPRMGGATLNSGGVPVPVTYHHQVTAQHPVYARTDQSRTVLDSVTEP
jgi:hypothetical protein